MAAETKRSFDSNAPARRKFDPNYFTWPNPFFMILIPFGLYLLVSSTFSPESIPAFLGPVGAFGKYMGNNYADVCMLLSIVTLIIHLAEAAYAGKVCLARGMTTVATLKWVFSTFIFGFSSLTLRLLPYRPDQKTSQHHQ